MADTPTDNQIDRYEADRRIRRRFIGTILFIITCFPLLLSMASYDWHDISMLQAPPQTPPANFFGLVGAWSVFMGYSFFGLAFWAVPCFLLAFSAILIQGRIQRTRAILLWSPLMLVALCCLMQIGNEGIFDFALRRLNQVDAGGIIGYNLMTRLLTRWFNPTGGAILMVGILLFALVMAVGFRNILSGLGRLTGWWALRQEARKSRQAETPAEDPEAAAERLRERARQAAEEARRKREEERQKKREAEPPPRPQPEPRKEKEPPAPTRKPATAKEPSGYQFPPVDLLNPIEKSTADHGNVREIEDIIVKTLGHYNIPVEVVGTIPGPVVTQYELRPAPHIKIERITALQGNIQMALEAKSIRIEAPIPGKNAVGIEVPNRRARTVTFREILEGRAWGENTCEIPLVLGKDVAGNDIVYDLAKAPHLLVAGATNSGKSVCLNSIITGFLMSRSPEQLRLILIDPKRVEFTSFNDLPHLLVPVINETKRVAFGLRWALIETEKRLKLFQKVNCRNIVAFNSRARQTVTQGDLFGAGADTPPDLFEAIPDKLPYIVIVVDEVADLMATVGKEVDPIITRIAAISRAAGIHLILATQRPSVNVITGTIKANIPGRIAFKVAQGNDSKTILDCSGAEDLIGKGDMLFLREGSMLQRAQGSWVSDNEILRVVEFVKEHCPPSYDQALVGKLERVKEAEPAEGFEDENEPQFAPDSERRGTPSDDDGAFDGESDEAMADKALEIICMQRRASVSALQRRMNLGYNRAGRIMDILEARGVVSPQGSAGKGAREILVDLDNLPPTAFSTPPKGGIPRPPATPDFDDPENEDPDED